MRIIAMTLAAVAAALVAFGAQAQNYPTRTITMVVPFSAGGPTDTVARQLSQAMGVVLKQSVIVENVVGAGGTIGPERVARSQPDGYTILLHHIGMSTAPSLYRQLRFKPLEDFEMIGLVADVPMTLIAKKDMPAGNFKDLVTYIKAHKDKISLANAGVGSASHLCGLLFMSAIQTDFVTVPYKGTGPAMNDLLGGQVDILCDQTTNTTGQIKSGKVKVYGVTTKSRVPALKDVPTLDEQGLKGFEVAVWHGVYAPKGTPKPALDKLVHALQEALKDANVKARFAELGTEPVPQNEATPEALRARLKSEIAKWGPIIQKAGVYAD